ncbi:MAG: CBS domain-containing protein [Gemmatimonadaceae bacterium]
MATDLRYFTVDARGRLLDAAEAIARNRSRCVIVVDGDKVTGVISEGDLVRALLSGSDIHAPLGPFVQVGFKFLERRDLARALELMRVHGISLVPVLNEAFALSDVITLADVLASVSVNSDA